MKKTEGELYWEGYDHGLLKAMQIVKKSFRTGPINGEDVQACLSRARQNTVEKLKAHYLEDKSNA